MTRKLGGSLALVLVTGLVAAGCGDDDESDGGGDAGTPPAAQPEGGSSPGGGANSAQVKQAVESCKQAITAAPQLQSDTKAELEKICEEGAEGDEQAVRESAKKVCLKITEDTIPAGPARQQAQQACEQAGATP